MMHWAPSPMWGLLASSTVCLSYQPSGLTPAGVLSLQPYPVTCFFNSLLKNFYYGISFLWTKSCHSHPFHDASREESSAANFDWEMCCFPPRLLTFFNKSLIVIIFLLMRRIDIVFMRHRELHQVDLFLFLLPYHQVWLFCCWDGEESLTAL